MRRIIVAHDNVAHICSILSTCRYTLEVSATDAGGLRAVQTITVDVLNRNDAPVIADGQLRSVPENSAPDTLVGAQLTFSDEDQAARRQSLSFTIIGGNTGNAFAIDAGQLSVFSRSALDFETSKQFTITVQIEDSGSPSLSATTTVVVDITDVNEPPRFTAVNFNGTIAENSKPGTLIGAPVTIADDDAGQSHVFSILGGSTLFAIDATSGQLSLARAALDFEDVSSYSIKVHVEDVDPSGREPLAEDAETTFMVTLIDVNEAPVWTAPAGAVSVLENSDAGVVLTNGNLHATDVDLADDGELVYSIAGGSGQNLFSIRAADGELSVKTSDTLNYEATDRWVFVDACHRRWFSS